MTKCLKIFLTDDDEDDREMFAVALSQSGIKCDLKMFENGVALAEFFESPQSPIPDVLFLDLNMPVLNGLATLQKLRSMEKCLHMKVIIYSTSNNANDHKRTFEAGANLYIEKPNNFATLRKMFVSLFGNSQDIKTTSKKDFVYRI